MIVNSQLAYVASSSSTGGDTQTGVGQLLLVNIANPAAPALSSTLDIPGTVQLANVALQGNSALVAGSTGGWTNPFGTASNIGFAGNVTLTDLDITNPQDPQIVGNTLVTEATWSPGLSNRRDLVNLGNGLYALSDVLVAGNPALLLIDASDPNNIVVSALNTPTTINGLTVSGNTLFAGTTDGLVTYNIGQLVSSPVTVSVQVPTDSANFSLLSNSFNIPPTQIIGGTSIDTLVWDRELAYGNTDLSFSWQTQLSNLNAGDTSDVTLGTTVSFVNQGTPGTLNLSATAVTATPIISLSPSSQTEQPGTTATYDVRLINPNSSQDTYDLSVQGLPSDWTDNLPYSDSVTIPADGAVDVPLTITSGVTDPLGTTSFTVTAVDGNGKAVGVGNGQHHSRGAADPCAR